MKYQRKILAPKVNVSHPSDVINKPFTGGAFHLIRTKFPKIRQYKIYIFNGPELKNGYVGAETNNIKDFSWRLDYISHSNPMKAFIKKHGRERYTKRYLGLFTFVDEVEKDKREGSFIEKYDTLRSNGINGYNPAKCPGFNTTGTHESEETKEKKKQTHLERYGYKYPTQRPEVKEKTRQTNLERYGYENSAQSPEIMKKMVRTMLERYEKYPGHTPILINQYSLDGTFIATYPSKIEATRRTGINLNNIMNNPGGFLWMKTK